jgi:outer membrane protein TolC
VTFLSIPSRPASRIKMFTYTFLVCLALFAYSGVASQLVSYSDLEPLVSTKNLHVRAAEDAQVSAERREGYFTRSLLPKISTEMGYESFQRELFRGSSQPYAGVQAELNLFNGGKDWLEGEIRQEETKINSAGRLQIFREELLKAQSEFWQIVFLTEQLNLLQAYAKRNSINLSAARKRIAAGSATESDQLEFEMTQRLIEQDISKAKTFFSNSVKKLNVLLGKEPTEIILVKESLPKKVDFEFEKKEIDSIALPEVVVSKAAFQIAKLKKAQGARWWMPKLDAYTGYKQMNMRESDEFLFTDRQEYFVGLKLSVYLFDGGESFSESRAQAALAKSFEHRATQSFRELSVEFENSKSELSQLSEQVNAASKDVEIAERFLGRILSEYSRGAKSSSEVLSASDRSFEFQKRYAELRRDYQVSKAKLLSLLPKGDL